MDSRLYLVVREGLARGTALTIPPGVCVVGAGEQAGVRIAAPGVSAEHLSVEVDHLGVAWATPLAGSSVSVNGKSIERRTMLEVGDRVGAGSVSLELAAGEWAPQASDTAVRQSDPNLRAVSAVSNKTMPPLSGPPPTPASILSPGQLVSDRYKVIDKLAAGGMGEVFRVQHVELGRLFALKVMRTELSSAPDFVDRFRREAVASSRIGHPNIVDITDFGRTEAGAFYFVMEHLDGLTLGDLVATNGPLSVPRVMHLARQMCSALAAAHAQSIVHRDLKPDNIMVIQRAGAPDTVKVLDFGIAKVESGHGRGGTTGVGVVVGTPQYMSPEQASGRPLDLRSDIYSMGLIFYELLAGKPAFNADTPPLLMMQQISEPAPPLPASISGKIPIGLERAIFAMLAKRADDRPQTMEGVLTMLDDARIPGVTGEIAPQKLPSAAHSLPPMFGDPTLPLKASDRPTTPQRPLGIPTRVDTPRARARTPGGSLVSPGGGLPVSAAPSTRAAIEAIRESKRQRDRARLLAFVVVGVVIVGAMGLAFRPAPRVEAPAPKPVEVVQEKPVVPPPPPALSSVELTVTSTPSGAQVQVNGVAKGVTPLRVSVERHEVTRVVVSLAGFETQRRDVSPDAAWAMDFALVAEKPAVVERPIEKPVAPVKKKPVKQPGLKDPYADDLKEVE